MDCALVGLASVPYVRRCHTVKSRAITPMMDVFQV